MDTIYCPYYELALPEVGLYCPNCLSQVKCTECNKTLLKDAKGCVFCGTPIGATKSGVPNQDGATARHNRIIIEESDSKRSVEATFSDNVAMHVAGLWSQNRRATPQIADIIDSYHYGSTEPADEEVGQDIPAITASGTAFIDAQPVVERPETDLLFDLFDDSDGRIRLLDTSLKADTLKESRVRATILALRYSELKNGSPSLSRDVLFDVMNDAKWFDKNYYGDLRDRTLLLEPTEGHYRLSRKGKERVDQVLSELLDPDISEQPVPQVGKPAKRTKEKDEGSLDTGSARKKRSNANGKLDVTSLVKEWDSSEEFERFRSVSFAKLPKLDLILIAIHAVGAARGTDGPVSHDTLSAFIKEAFGVTYSPRAIADRAAKEDGKRTITYERSRGYILWTEGEKRLGELGSADKGTEH